MSVNKIFIDTDIFIDYLRGWPNAKSFFEKIESTHIFFSAVTEAEILSGKECSKPERIKGAFEILSRGTKIPVDNRIAKFSGYLRRTYDVEVVSDAIIAATALVMKAKLITRNLKDFKKIKEISVEAPY